MAFDVQGAIKAGYTMDEINQYLATQKQSAPAQTQTPQIQQPQPVAQSIPSTQPKTLEGFASNIGISAVKNAKDIGSGIINIVNPDLEQNTLANLAKLGIDLGKIAAGDKSENNRAKLLAKFYVNRYGSIDKAVETAYTDPVGVALDASAVLEGGGALLKGAGVISKSSKVAQVGELASKAGRMIDPVAQATEIVGKGVGKMTEATQGVRDSTSSFLAKKSIKANPSQLEKFKDLTGKDLGNFMKDSGIYTYEDAQKAIKPLQSQYDNLVRTGKEVPGSVYAKNLRSKALEILTNDQSPSARQLAEKIWNEADVQEKIGNVTDTVLTNTKSNVFNKVTDKSLIDPLSDNFNKVMGQVGIQTLEQIAPGSSKVGKKLQAIRQFQDVAKRQSELGKGAQLFNLLKPGVGGAVVGNVIPGVGPIAGAIAGEAVTNPLAQRTLAKILQTGVPGGKFASEVGNAALNTGKSSRTLLPTDSSQVDRGVSSQVALPAVNGSTTNTGSATQSQQVNTYDQSISQHPDTGNQTMDQILQPAMERKIKPEQLMQVLMSPQISAKTKAALKDAYDVQEQAIKEQTTQSKPLAAVTENRVQLAKSGLRALTELESIYKKDSSKVLKAAIPGSLGARDYQSAAYRAVEGLLRARSGAAVPETEVRRYMNANLPQVGDSESDVKGKLAAFRKDLEDVANSGGGSGAEDVLNQILNAGKSN